MLSLANTGNAACNEVGTACPIVCRSVEQPVLELRMEKLDSKAHLVEEQRRRRARVSFDLRRRINMLCYCALVCPAHACLESAGAMEMAQHSALPSSAAVNLARVIVCPEASDVQSECPTCVSSWRR